VSKRNVPRLTHKLQLPWGDIKGPVPAISPSNTYVNRNRKAAMKIALAQLSIKDNIEDNLERAVKVIMEAAANDADLVLFPEIQLHKFFPQYRNVPVAGMEINSPCVQAICDACRKYHIMAAPNFYLAEQGRCYDATVLIGRNGEIIGIQKMVHIAQAEGFYEQDYYTPADDGFQVFDTPEGRIGMVICFDRHYPESIRTEALMGADLILIPTANTAEEPSEMFEWEVRVQAFQNSVAIAMCNRTGKEGEMNFCGESLIVDAKGNVAAKAGREEEILYCAVDLSAVKGIRAAKPYTSLRRKSVYC